MNKKKLIAIVIVQICIFSSLLIVTQITTDGTGQLAVESSADDLLPTDKEDVDIILATNTSTIGQNKGVLGNLSVENQGVNVIGDITVDFDFGGEYATFSENYLSHQELSTLAPGATANFNIELMLNETFSQDDLIPDTADVCLVFDSSGSMGNEIEDVKQEFLTLTSSLTQTIPSLRFAMIVYGWNKYNQYPTLNKNNYLDFTDDYEAVDDFISALYASGGTEPWGDALYLANTFSWRPEASKLLIIVGDEDCDPGVIVGKDSTASYYNGPELVEAAQNLVDKGVQLNAILTDGIGMVETQFEWLAEIGNGEMIDLQELNSGGTPVNVPEIIEEMTLSLSREYYVNLTATVNWIEYTSGGDETYSETTFTFVIIDLAPPSISTTTLVYEELDMTCTLDISATIYDPSEIAVAQVIWTEDDLETTINPVWEMCTLTTKIENTYFESFENLTLNQKFSFYIVASDVQGNVGTTAITNLTITTTPKYFGEAIEFGFMENYSAKRIHFDLTTRNEAYLAIRTNDSISVYVEHPEEVDATLVYLENKTTIFHITKIAAVDSFSVVFSGNQTTDPIKVLYNTLHFVTQEDLTFEYYMGSHYTSHLFKAVLTTPGSGYLSLLAFRSPLVTIAHVYYTNWTKVGDAKVSEALAMSNGTYYIWVERIIRDGMFGLHYGPEPIEDYDPYYGAAYSAASIPMPIVLVSIALTLLSFIAFLTKRRKT